MGSSPNPKQKNSFSLILKWKDRILSPTAAVSEMGFSPNPKQTTLSLCSSCLLPLLLFLFLAAVAGDQSSNAFSLDSGIKDSAFAALSHQRTGVLYNVPVPANLSGVSASVVRLRARGLWVGGAHFAGIRIPAGTLPEPYVKRMAIVYQNLANWSSNYYMVPGYTLVSPVLGLLVYNTSSGDSTNGLQQIGLRVTRGSIELTFPQLKLPLDSNSTAKCVTFPVQKPPNFSELQSPNSCSARGAGHFAIAVPIPSGSHPPAGGGRWELWWVVVVGGGTGVVLVVLVVVGVVGFVNKKRMVEMERKGEEGEALGSVLVGASKMPRAPMTRTKPILESGNGSVS